MHLVAQFGHIALMHTIFRIVTKTQTSKFLMMFDRYALFSRAFFWPAFDAMFVLFRAGWTCLHYAVYHGLPPRSSCDSKTAQYYPAHDCHVMLQATLR